ncbi:MAG: hypothetical protein U9O94_08490 [Nanoarchaeota archaeon]|nr:hypothetical protein [Nanoarchaeota archaeon]
MAIVMLSVVSASDLRVLGEGNLGECTWGGWDCPTTNVSTPPTTTPSTSSSSNGIYPETGTRFPYPHKVDEALDELGLTQEVEEFTLLQNLFDKIFKITTGIKGDGICQNSEELITDWEDCGIKDSLWDWLPASLKTGWFTRYAIIGLLIFGIVGTIKKRE